MAKNTTTAAAPAAAKPEVGKTDAVITAVSTAVKMPEYKRRSGGRGSSYPFEALTAVGMSFGVTNKNARQLGSVVSNANKKNKVPKRDENGNIVFKTREAKDANGNAITVPTTDPELVPGKEFFVVDTDPKTDPDKATARVFRKL